MIHVGKGFMPIPSLTRRYGMLYPSAIQVAVNRASWYRNGWLVQPHEGVIPAVPLRKRSLPHEGRCTP